MKEQIYPSIGETVYRDVLPNGLPVNVVSKPGFAKSYAFFAAKYGGMDTRFQLNGTWHDTPAGIAHYLEHKMFDTQEGNALQELAKNGAEPNAFTANAMTGYYFDCTTKFEENLKILLSFVSVPYFTDESVAKEQGIIAQEIRMIEDEPERQVYTGLMDALFQNSTAKTHIAGSVESIQEITAQTLYHCHHAFYTPGNMVLNVVGDVDPERVRDIALEILPKDSGSAVPRDHGEEPAAVAQKEVSRNMEVAMPIFLLGYKCAPAKGGEDHMRRSLIGSMASDLLLGESSPLYLRLYDQGLINTSFGGSFELMPGVAFLYAGGDSRDVKTVTEEIQKEIRRIAAEGLDPDFYQRVLRAAFGSMLRSLNSFQNIAVSLTEGQFAGYDPLRFPQVFDSIRQEDILAFIREELSPEHGALSTVVPV
jgi:predicted Zn-dependent peptidase